MDDFAERVLFAVVVALLIVGGTARAPQALATRDGYSADFNATFSTRYWSPQTACTGGYGDNISTFGCLGWNNTSIWACGRPYTHLFDVTQPSIERKASDASGFGLNYTMTGTFVTLPAGTRALQGAGSFNDKFCYKSGNATAADAANFTAELAAINLTIKKGKGTGSWIPVQSGSNFTFGGQSETRRGGRQLETKFGNESVQVSVDSSVQWNCATCNFSNVTESGGSLKLSPVAGGNPFAANSSTTGLWHLNGDSGDNSTNANFMTASTASYIWNSSGNFSSAWDKTANDQNTRLREKEMFGWTNGSLTVELWWYVKTSASWQVLVWIGGAAAGTPTHGIWIHGGPLYFFRTTDGGGARDCSASVALNTNQWHHMAMSVDRNASIMRGFVDGTQVCSVATGGSALVFPVQDANSDSMVVGGTTSDVVWANQVMVDEIRISNFAAYTSNFAVPTASSVSARGNWTSAVLDTGTAESSTTVNTRWLNFTNTSSSMKSGTGVEVFTRGDNVSFANNSSNIWNPLGNGTADGTPTALVNFSGNRTRFRQFMISLYGSGADTPSVDAFLANFSRMPTNNESFSGNVSFARPASAGVSQSVSVRIPYRDPDGGIGTDTASVRLGILNESGGPEFCANQTFATQNTSSGVYCNFVWNSTTDGESPAFVGNLTDSDGVWNLTNSSRPIRTDNAPPLTGIDAIANTSTGSFVLNIGAVDNSSGVNRSWYSVYNLSNSSDGSAVIVGLANITWAANGTVVLCPTCYGQIRVSAQADDNLPATVRFNSTLANRTFWFDPAPTVAAPVVSQPSGTDLSVGVTVSARAFDVVANVTTVRLAVASPSGVSGIYQMSLSSGTPADGTWTVSFTPSLNFSGQGTYQLQVLASSPTTTAEGASPNGTLVYGSAGGGTVANGAAAAAGGGAPSSIFSTSFSTPPPGATATALANVSGGLTCPTDIRQTLSLTPRDGDASVWSYDCRAVSGFSVTDCRVRGELAAANGSLTGQPDPAWSCQVTGPDTVRVQYRVLSTAVPDSWFSKALAWNTFARVTVISGTNQTGIDVRLLVVNLAPPVPLPIPGLDGLVAAVTPLSPTSLVLAAVFAAAAGLLFFTGSRFGFLWAAAVPAVAYYGLGSPQGPGITLWWLLYGGAGVAAWTVTWLATAKKIRLLRAGL